MIWFKTNISSGYSFSHNLGSVENDSMSKSNWKLTTVSWRGPNFPTEPMDWWVTSEGVTLNQPWNPPMVAAGGRRCEAEDLWGGFILHGRSRSAMFSSGLRRRRVLTTQKHPVVPKRGERRKLLGMWRVWVGWNNHGFLLKGRNLFSFSRGWFSQKNVRSRQKRSLLNMDIS